MKLFRSLILLSLLGPVVAQEDLGNVMFVGDSITHGYKSPSYRWNLHKIMVDNDITYKSVGVMTGNQGRSIAPDTVYRGVAFNNIHASQSSARAYEISGDLPAGKGSSRFGKSNLNNWLGFSDKKNDNQSYSGNTFKGDDAPAHYFMMIGTNDLLSDNNEKLAQVAKEQNAQLLKNVQSICESMKKANPKAQIVINHIPAWKKANVDAPEVHQAVDDYNALLAKWAAKQKHIKIVDVNKGLIDVSAKGKLFAVAALVPDGIHPSEQGDLIISGNMAKAMGWGGRTAGLERKATLPEKLQVDLTKGTSVTHQSEWEPNEACTLEFHASIGDGAKKGWHENDAIQVTVSNGSQKGVLNFKESAIYWGDTVLYSLDNSANQELIRVAYVAGDAAQSLPAGYYVWLGDMLIGEGLPCKSGGLSGDDKAGVEFRYESTMTDGTAAKKPGPKLPVKVSKITYDAKGSYAPGKGMPAVKAPKKNKK